jgi:hypothetical protein
MPVLFVDETQGMAGLYATRAAESKAKRQNVCNQSCNYNFTFQHYANVFCDPFNRVLTTVDQLMDHNPKYYITRDISAQVARWSSVYGATQIIAACLHLMRQKDNRQNQVFSIDEILQTCAEQRKHVSEQIKRPKQRYIRKRDHLADDPMTIAGYIDVDPQDALKAGIALLMKCGWFLLTDAFELEVNPAVTSIGHNTDIACGASELGMELRSKINTEHRFELNLSKRTINFLAYVAHTGWRDFWRLLAICTVFGANDRSITGKELYSILNMRYPNLFGLCMEDERNLFERRRTLLHSQKLRASYWLRQYDQRGWIGHWSKTEALVSDYKSPEGMRRCGRSEKADIYLSSSYWTINPSIAATDEIYDEIFFDVIGRYFDRADSLSDPRIDILGIFHARDLRHAHYVRWARGKKLDNWGKQYAHEIARVVSFAGTVLMQHLRKFMTILGIKPRMVEANEALCAWTECLD